MTNEAIGAAQGRNCALVAIKVLHTGIWTFFVGCILALPVAGGLRHFRLAAILTVLILIECFVLVVNRWRCPLTDVAARYTTDRSPDFDIYLPVWLARHNKTVFGVLFLVNEAIVIGQWLRMW